MESFIFCAVFQAYLHSPITDCGVLSIQPEVVNDYFQTDSQFMAAQFNSNKTMLYLNRNQSSDLHCKSIDWFLHESNIGLLWIKTAGTQTRINLTWTNKHGNIVKSLPLVEIAVGHWTMSNCKRFLSYRKLENLQKCTTALSSKFKTNLSLSSYVKVC